MKGQGVTQCMFFRLRRVPIDAKGDALADLGYGVLDTAMVETAAYVLERVPQ